MIASTEFEALFDEAGYLAKYPDVDRGVQAGAWSSGWHHFSRRGQYEGRTIDGFSLINYRRAVPPLTDEKIPPGQEPEPVRLIIWDLDDTFWKGTVTEGGIDQYVQEHHDIVIELAKRGIMSSICSKNDSETILKILEEKGILDYFIFPSISWESKGNRIQSIIESVQLRPATVMFIDDNPSNRAEAASLVPDLQIVDETFISKILTDPSFKGKDDSSLSRLAQYKLLETRTQDEKKASGNNEEFLRSCNIRVHIEYDVASHLDRAIELINRTNQLNYTKNRLPDDPTEAREALVRRLSAYNVHAALIRVSDKYGDYGFCGLYIVSTGLDRTDKKQLIDYCFSCRILNMGVETWLYRHLGRPILYVVGDILTDVFDESETIDWITQGENNNAVEKVKDIYFDKVVLRGGCDLMPLELYFKNISKEVICELHSLRSGVEIRNDHSIIYRMAIEPQTPEIRSALQRLGYTDEDIQTRITERFSGRTLVVLGFAMDHVLQLVRHKSLDLSIPVLPPLIYPLEEMVRMRPHLEKTLRNEWAENLVAELRENYVYNGQMSEELFKSNISLILSSIQKNVSVVIILQNDLTRNEPLGSGRHIHLAAKTNSWIADIADQHDNVTLINIRDCIRDEREVDPVNPSHFDRIVYHRLFETIRDKV